MTVYFIRVKSEPFVKIGWADDVDKRLRDLQCWNHKPLLLMATLPGGSQVELRLHKQFKLHRLHGEWFALDGHLAEYITTLPQAPEPLVSTETIWLQEAASNGWRLPRKRGVQLGAASKLDDTLKAKVQRLAKRTGEKRMTIQAIADQSGIAMSTIFAAFPGGRKAIIAWKPK